jgi:hypothetical protein
MRVWNKPELAEININETANGLLPLGFEFCIFTNDDYGCDHPKEKEKEVTPPTDPKRKTDEWS